MRACGALNLGPTFPSLTHVELITRCYITWRHPGPSSFIDSQRLELRRWIWCFNSMATGGTKVKVMMTSLCVYLWVQLSMWLSQLLCTQHVHQSVKFRLLIIMSSQSRNNYFSETSSLGILFFISCDKLRYFFNDGPRFFIRYLGRSMYIAMHCNILRC